MIDLVFRIATSGIFVVAGIGHMLNTGHIVERLEAAPLGFLATWLGYTDLLVMVSGGSMALGGLALAAGWKTRWAALGLIAILVPITITVQLGSVATVGPLFKNIAILGALAYLAVMGAGSWSLDARAGRTA